MQRTVSLQLAQPLSQGHAACPADKPCVEAAITPCFQNGGKS